MNAKDARFADFVLHDPTWGLAMFARPEQRDRIEKAGAAIQEIAAGRGSPDLASHAEALSGFDASYDCAASETKEAARSDAAAAVALYAAEGRMDEAAKAHAWGWSAFGVASEDVAAAQAKFKRK